MLADDTISDNNNNTDCIKLEIMFTCRECENQVKLYQVSIDGLVEIDLFQIVSDLIKYPSKVIYVVCPVCGMEYELKKIDKNLYLYPTVLEK
ncbi:MAG: hypothetical protein NZZ41_06330 [Candidatus Dojkabacteria bacterium]|nr:hypothetical protein [Candidatus Dojkabacteria bacterium]